VVAVRYVDVVVVVMAGRALLWSLSVMLMWLLL